MYAIVETGGKQFRVEEGLKLKVAKLALDAGEKYNIDKVLMVGGDDDLQVGQPYVEGAKVNCQVIEHGRDKKVIVFKKKRRKDYRKKQGHRQDYTFLQVSSIEA